MSEQLAEVDRLRASLLSKPRVSDPPLPDGGEITGEDVLFRIEHMVQSVVGSLSAGEAPALVIRNRALWSNIRFDDSIGLQTVSDSTVTTVRSDCSSSVVRFALTLKLLSVIYKLVQSNTYATKRYSPTGIFPIQSRGVFFTSPILTSEPSERLGYLLSSSVTPMDIYYNDTQLFGSQRTVDLIVDDISCMLRVPRRGLHVLATSKGFITGDLCYTEEDGSRVNCESSSTPILVSSNVCGIKNIVSSAKFILIVEKDATFQRLLDDDFCTKLAPCIMITGKGVPDVNSRLMVRKLWDSLLIPVFALVDADPHGIEIMCIYKYGSLSMSFEAHNLTVPAVMWLGLLPSDIERLNVPKDALIPFTKTDHSKLNSLQKRPYITSQPLWEKEMELMLKWKLKAEIQSLTSIAPDFLTRVYLPNKLHYGGWI